MNGQNVSFQCGASKASKFAVFAMMLANIFMHGTHVSLQCRVSGATIVTRFTLIGFINGSVNISHMRDQFCSVGEGFATHRTLASGQGATFFGVALHMPVNTHLGSGLEFTKAALELLDGDFVDAADMLFKQTTMFSNVSALTAFVARFCRSRSLFSVNILDVDVHVLFACAFVVAVGTIEWFQSLMYRIFVSDQITSVAKTFVAFLASPRPQFLMDHFDVLNHVGFLVEPVAANITDKRLFFAMNVTQMLVQFSLRADLKRTMGAFQRL